MEDAAHFGELLRDDLLHTGVLKPDGVDHTRGALGDARRGIAEAGLKGRALEGKRTENVDVVKLGKFIAEAERAAGGDDRIVDLNTRKIYLQLFHRISSFTSTGPSRQMRLLPVTVLQEQPMQAPKPQPIRSSKLYCPEVTVAPCRARSIGSGPQV